VCRPRGGLCRGAAEATGEVEVAAAIGDDATTPERRATDCGGVLPGEAELAGSDVGVVAAVGDGYAMTASDAAERRCGLIGLAELVDVSGCYCCVLSNTRYAQRCRSSVLVASDWVDLSWQHGNEILPRAMKPDRRSGLDRLFLSARIVGTDWHHHAYSSHLYN
jgi:hypothetical protein